MDIIDELVWHTQFGTGTVVNQTPLTITVRFGEEQGEKKFLYPSAFESFLTFSNTNLQASMKSEICEIHDREEAVRRDREEETKNRIDVERKELLVKKRAAAKTRARSKVKAKKAQVDADKIAEG